MLYGLSLTQPWATLMALGAKHNETRAWGPTGHVSQYRGSWVVLHATKQCDKLALGMAAFRRVLTPAGYSPLNMPAGQVVALGCLADVHRIDRWDLLDSTGPATKPAWWPAKDSAEWIFGNYQVGRWVWHFDPILPLVVPVTMRGRPGLFTVEPADATLILAQIDPKDLPNDVHTPTPD